MNKIRVWNHTTKQYLLPEEIKDFLSLVKIEENLEWTYPAQFKVENSSAMHDINGKEIYEGDVIIAPNLPGFQEVCFTPAAFRYGSYNDLLVESFIAWDDLREISDVNIVGNLMSNPDLIKRENVK